MNPQHTGHPWAGMEWDEHVEGWIVKDAPDGRRVWVVPYMFTSAIVIGDPDAWEYDDRWCYETSTEATLYARSWSAEPRTEPSGWHRHPITGRRRPGGDRSREYLMQ